MTSPRLLLVEDDPGLRRTLTDFLASKGFAVEGRSDGVEGQIAAENGGFDIIVLDVILPSRNGLEVCRNLRKKGVQTPILILTARTQLDHKVEGFGAGADDYLTKPFEPVELHMRIQALLRRGSLQTRQRLKVYEFQGIHVDFEKARLTRNGKVTQLSERECRLLQHLVESGGAVVSRDQLLHEVWGYGEAPMTRTVDVHIAWLRQKLETDPANPEFIVTVHGQGYRFRS